MNCLKRAWAEINLDALIHNFEIIKAHTDTKIFSVVKANAYGHSAPVVSKILDDAGTDFFAVSNIDEAQKLRECGINKPILILGYTPPSLASDLKNNNLIQCVFSYEYAEQLNSFAEKSGVIVQSHIKLDTGMGRIGFDCRTEQLSGLDELEKTLLLKNIEFSGVFTHFCVADSVDDSNISYTSCQYERFIKAIKKLEEKNFYFRVRHCCNSAAIFSDKSRHLDAVRAGILLYGLTPSTELDIAKNFKPVMTFKAVVSMVKEMDKEQFVSYGRTHKINAPSKIATVSAGYADGVSRLLSGKGKVLINGKLASIVGRICMDQFCIDVSEIQDVKQGDVVTLFGEGLPVEEMAQTVGTINYELVCAVSSRVPRVYIKDGQVIDF